MPGSIRISHYRKGMFTIINSGRCFFTQNSEKDKGFHKRTVALVNWTSSDPQTQTSTEFTYLDGENERSVWPTGVPSDGTPIEVEHYPFLVLMVLVYLFAVAGLVFTVICLVFNVTFRNRK